LARRYSDRKALSPVISTLLMISATITMFVILFAGFVPSITLTQSQANIWYTKQGDAARERISIEMIVFNSANLDHGALGPDGKHYSIDVYVRNVQDIEVKIAGIFINSSLQTPPRGFIQTSIYPSLPAKVYAPALNLTTGVAVVPVVKFQVPYVWYSADPPAIVKPGALYDIKVVTARGSDAVCQASAPLAP
jgi:uncharacterized membrane protein